MNITVSIIICTANKPDSLAETLNSLGQTIIPHGIAAELIVVDNWADTSRQAVTKADLQNMTVKYIQEPKKGKSYALNCGMANASCDILVFSDDDLRFPTDWVPKLIEPILANEADAVAGTARMSPDLERSWMTPYHQIYYAQELESTGQATLIGANCAFHRRVLESVPGFDVDLGPGAMGFCDDSLFSSMLTVAGFRVVFNPNAEVRHCFDQSRLTRPALLNHAERLGRSVGYCAYHWEHREISAPYLRRLRKAWQIKKRLASQTNLKPTDEGCDEAELFEVNGWAIIDQYMKESSKPRKYARPDLKSQKRNPVAALFSDIVKRVPSGGA